MHSLCNHIMAWRQILSGKICTDLGYSNILRFVCSIGISRGILWPSCLSHFRCFFRCCRRCYDIALVFPEQKHPWDKSKELQIWLEFLPGRSLFATRKSPPKLEENRLRREQGCLRELISATGRFGSRLCGNSIFTRKKKRWGAERGIGFHRYFSLARISQKSER